MKSTHSQPCSICILPTETPSRNSMQDCVLQATSSLRNQTYKARHTLLSDITSTQPSPKLGSHQPCKLHLNLHLAQHESTPHPPMVSSMWHGLEWHETRDMTLDSQGSWAFLLGTVSSPLFAIPWGLPCGIDSSRMRRETWLRTLMGLWHCLCGSCDASFFVIINLGIYKL